MNENTADEGMATVAVEKQTAKVSSGAYMAVSLGLKMYRKKNTALFVCQWAAPFLIMGLYNKLVKTEGYD